MILKKMVIEELQSWERKEGQPAGHKGKITFGDERGEISLNLSRDHIDAIFNICANAIIETARTAARDMTCAVIQQAEGVQILTERPK